MSLPKPNLDDKRFFQIVEESRALIPSRAPEWTDHNVHDPGITFIELFSWLVEIQHYRLNRVSDESFGRFFELVGLTPRHRHPAEVTIAFDFPGDQAVFVPAGARIVPISINDLPFETIDDFFLTPVRLRGSDAPPLASSLKRVVTRAAEREIRQAAAEVNPAGHYDAFGPNPKPGDSLSLAFDKWFVGEEEIRLSIVLFEDDLPPRNPLLPDDAPGFVPSATLKWEFLTKDAWAALDIIADTTLHLSQSGELIFRVPQPAVGPNELYWIRATLVDGSYEIPPRIAALRTNSIRARQVETIVNEELGNGLGTPDQIVRLKKTPVLLDSTPNGSPFLAGEVLDWRALIFRLAILGRKKNEPDKFVPARATAVLHVAEKLGDETKEILVNPDITNPSHPGFATLQEKARYPLAQSLKKLLDDPSLYDRRVPCTREPADPDHTA